ncbi:fimbria/pilus periplasmic chaperone [Enterobacter ludwigii]|uniref:fimbria/pilus periplasmic chaperone n=1 Tax=Enterobacter ludwigii TaxID=299767 RepID=UPI002101D0E4|nr:fimbria/pilus periplasmic chaperone [Enterobacter ludwigii]
MRHSSVNTCQAMAGVILCLGMAAQTCNAAIAFDRTRVIFNAGEQSTIVFVKNENKQLPYLAQTWVEDASGKKTDAILTALPPVQRVEAGEKGQIKIQSTGSTASLPQNKESLFYFNVREIPPRSNKPNTLQIALQTRVKMFYRPASIVLKSSEMNEPLKKLTMTRSGDGYVINNPTPYFISVVAASAALKGKDVENFESVMIPPESNEKLDVRPSSLGSRPVLTAINDFGGRPKVVFDCSAATCSVSSVEAG